MTDPARCPRCHSLIPADLSDRLCPTCLLALVARYDEGGGSSEAPTMTSPGVLQSSPPGGGLRLEPGQMVGPYRIERLLGRGGMGEVYEAERVGHVRRVALKVLGRRLRDAEDRDRFLREGELAAAINHPNSVYIFSSEDIDGIPAIAMELLHGGTLKDVLDREHTLEPGPAVDAMLQVIAGLEAAAAAGILHRDIKPSNCFLDRDGIVKIGDFGLSISTVAREAVSESSSMQGTPAFASPEQLGGRPLDVRADIYSVGATLYCLLTGHPPFEERDLATLLARVANDVPASPREANPAVPRGLASEVLRCLAKSPEARHPDYRALRAALEPYASESPNKETFVRRVVAFLFDFQLLRLLTMPVMDVARSSSSAALPASLVILVVACAYFAIGNGVFGRTLGKEVLGLRVVGPKGGTPGVVRGFVRTLLLVLPLLGYLSGYQVERPLLPALAVLVLPVALIATARPGNRYAGLHDWLAGTRVMDASSMRPVARPALATAPSLGTGHIGPYAILDGETLDGSPGDHAVVRGYDERLRRPVWIHTVPIGSPAVPVNRREVGRMTRPRWLNGRRTEHEAWDAYEAIDGAPVDVDPRDGGRTYAWPEVRAWMLALAGEIRAGLKDHTLPSLTTDRVWVGEGRVVLLDWSTRPPYDPSANSAGSPEVTELDRAQLLLAALARRAERRGPLPLRAAQCIEWLEAGMFRGGDELHASLVALEAEPAEVTRGRRAAHLAWACALPAIALLVMASSILAEPLLLRERPGLIAVRSCLHQLAQAERYGSPADVRALRVHVRTHLRKMLGPRSVRADPSLKAFLGLDLFRVALDAERSGAVGDTAVAPLPSSLHDVPRQQVTVKLIEALLKISQGLALAGIIGVFLGAFRGGTGFRSLGMMVVGGDGRQVSWARGMLRALVAWTPAFVAALALGGPVLADPVNIIYVWLEGSNPLLLQSSSHPQMAEIPSMLWLRLTLLFVSLATMMAGAVYAVRHPTRGLQDRLAGTWIVPGPSAAWMRRLHATRSRPVTLFQAPFERVT